jgi:CRP/FNR family cyclic AMP-dependent transcriptional regulator
MAALREKGDAFVRKRVKASFDPKKFLAKVGEGKTISQYPKDQIVFSQGEIADAVFYIQQGKVKLTVVSEQGKEAVVAILGPGQFFGEACLNGHPLRIATTRAVEECLITRLEEATRRSGCRRPLRKLGRLATGGSIGKCAPTKQ